MLHKKLGEQGCISCRTDPSIAKSVLCQACYDDALSRAPALIQVPNDHKNYKSVVRQFKHTWRHKTTCPEVKAVYKIVVADASMTQYQEYLDSVEARGNFASMGKSPGNENRRWHGTRRKCRLGDTGYQTFCADTECALCCIIRTSFDLKFFQGGDGLGEVRAWHLHYFHFIKIQRLFEEFRCQFRVEGAVAEQGRRRKWDEAFSR